MSQKEETEARALFERLRAGDASAASELFPLVYEHLRSLAQKHMASQDPAHTLQATALVNEAYLRLFKRPEWADRTHFLRVASTAMRQILVDHARAKNAQKRGTPERVDLDALVAQFDQRAHGLVELDAALERLARRDPLLAKLVELRFFGANTLTEASAVLGISERQATRWWHAARAFLLKDLHGA